MTLKDGIGILFAAGGIMLLALGRAVLGPRGELYCGILVVIGIGLIWHAKRQRDIEEALDEFPARRDGDSLTGSHDLDLPDHD
jgi:hypothetical protein